MNIVVPRLDRDRRIAVAGVVITECFPCPDAIPFSVAPEVLFTAVEIWIQHMPNLGRRVLGLSLDRSVKGTIIGWPTFRAANSGDLLCHGLEHEIISRSDLGLVHLPSLELGRRLLIISRHSHHAKVSY